MKKIPSVFRKNYEGDGLATNEIVPGAEWVVNGEGIATVKWDGTCCMMLNGELYKRYDRKLHAGGKKRLRYVTDYVVSLDDFKAPPEGWIPCQDEPDTHTHHWPGWLPVDDSRPEDKWHVDAWQMTKDYLDMVDGTYELIGEKVNGNPHAMNGHVFRQHGDISLSVDDRSFEGIREKLRELPREGIVFHHAGGKMAKVKRRDFGFAWPLDEDTRDAR